MIRFAMAGVCPVALLRPGLDGRITTTTGAKLVGSIASETRTN